MSTGSDWYQDPEILLTELKRNSAPGAATPEIPGYADFRDPIRGGQGVVYAATQVSTKRKVAIKILLEGAWASESRQFRFAREIDLIANLRHPNIVQLYDSGVTSDGYQYYVMEFIDGAGLDQLIGGIPAPAQAGVALDARVDDAETRVIPVFSTRATLELFAKVCEAVNFAHQRGVIHRDLKPSNIRIDPDSSPHVLDFGLAKSLLEMRDEHAPEMSRTGEFMGSAPWASPEQTLGDPGKIDLRTDVYSLGVILYQMLTGEFPYDVSGDFTEVIENIRSCEPRRPSAAQREVDDETDTIVLKCLSKEPERRYQTAGELARDIRRYLEGEPIAAKRDSVTYMLRKQLRRYKASVAAAAALTAVVTVAFIISVAFWNQARDERDEARRAGLAESTQRERAEAGAALANLEKGKADAINHFLREMLASVDPWEAGRDVSVREVLDEAARKIEKGAFSRQPEIEAAVRTTIGQTYQELGLYESAEPHLRNALRLYQACLGESHPDVARGMDHLAQLLYERGDYDAAEPLFRGSLNMLREQFDHEKAEIATALNNLGQLLYTRGDYGGAEDHYKQALALWRKLEGDVHIETATCLNNLATLRCTQGAYDEAVALCRQSLDVQRRLPETQHRYMAHSLNNLAIAHMYNGDLPAAEPPLREALEILRGVHADQHPSVAVAMTNLARLLWDMGDLTAAESLYREALTMLRKLLGDEHPQVVTALSSLAVLVQARGDYEQAEPILREVLGARRKLLGERHPDVAWDLNNLAFLFQDLGDYNASIPLLRESLSIQREKLTPGHPDLAVALAGLGTALNSRRNYREAEVLVRECLEIRRQTMPDHWLHYSAMSVLGETLAGQGKFEEAQPLLQGGYAGLERVAQTPPPRLQDALERLISFYEASNQPDQAASWRAKLPSP